VRKQGGREHAVSRLGYRSWVSLDQVASAIQVSDVAGRKNFPGERGEKPAAQPNSGKNISTGP